MSDYKSFIKEFSKLKKFNVAPVWRTFIRKSNRSQMQELIEDVKSSRKDLQSSNLNTINRGLNTFEGLKRNNNVLTDLLPKITRNLFNLVNQKKDVLVRFEQNGEEKFLTLRKSQDIRDFFEVLQGGKLVVNQGLIGSDIIEQIGVERIDNVRISQVERKEGKKAKQKGGKFFNKINKSEFDLSKYQIYKSFEDYKNKGGEEHCIIHTLRLWDVNETLLNKIKLSMHCEAAFNKNKLKDVSEKIKKQIVLHYIREKNGAKEKDKVYFGKQFKQKISIALYNEHYFTEEYTDFTINDIELLKGKKYPRINGNLTSLQLVKILDENNYFEKNGDLIMQIKNRNTNTRKYLLDKNIENEQEEFIFNPKDDKNKLDIFFADTETTTNEGKHKILLAGIVGQKDDRVKLMEVNPENEKGIYFEMLNYAVFNSRNDAKIIIYFHNLKYDFSFMKNMYVKNIVQKDGTLYSAKLRYKKREIELRDSYKMINVGLKDFNSMMGLDKSLDKKEAIAYDFYRRSHLINSCVKVKDYEKALKESDIKQFRENLKNNKINFNYDGTYFDCIKYYKYYLKYDCLVLKAGLEKFNKSMCEMNDGQSIFDFLTISSYIDYYVKKNKAYDNVFQVSGNIRQFLSKAVMGGRCAVNETYQKKIIENEALTDFDAVSLYPSAIKRLCDEMGLPTGKARIIENINNTENLDYYVVKVRITKVNKNQQIPFICVKDEEGLCNYINDVGDGVDVIIDKITLEDYKAFHEIEYQIIEGVYWNGRFNKTLGTIICKLFENRKNEKAKMKKYNETEDKYKEHNLNQTLIKLMLNSIYGKTIIKQSFDTITIRDKETVDDYILDNYDNIIGGFSLNDKQVAVEEFKMDTSFNLSHVGIAILSYSKRIMNEVFNICNDNNLIIYYQDTDSMHMKQKDLKTLEKIYNKKYNKDLIGKELGQLHEDFDFDGHKDIVSNFSVFIGKKIYLDVLEGTNINNGKLEFKTHVRIKGVNKVGIEGKIKEIGGDEIEAYKKLFTSLAKGEKNKFVLNPKHKPSFDFKNFNVSSRETGEFVREI